MVTVGVIHQKSGMHFEKLCQQRARGLGHMRTTSALDLREIRLADAFRLWHLCADGANQFQLRHRTPQTAQRSFDLPQVTDFFAQLHVAPR